MDMMKSAIATIDDKPVKGQPAPETEHAHVDLIVRLPDALLAALAVGDARARIQRLLSDTAEAIATIVTVAEQDRRALPAEQARQRSAAADPNRGPDQIAFAGTKAPAVEVPRA
jgi:hypothetical protein